MDPIVEVKKQYKLYLVAALARHFGAKKEDVRKDVNLDEDDIIQFDSLRPYGFREIFFSAHTDTTKHETFFYGDRFYRCDVYRAFVEAEAQVDPEWRGLFVMSLHRAGTHYVVYRSKDRNYDGIGGILLKLPDGDYFIIEPIENFLEYYYPPTKEEG